MAATCTKNEEFLLYDFSVYPGDSLDLCIHYDPVDSVYDRKLVKPGPIIAQDLFGLDSTIQITAQPPPILGTNSYHYHEGVGSREGLFMPQVATIQTVQFLYFYCRNADNGCPFVVSNDAFVPENRLEVKFQPIGKNLLIQNKTPESSKKPQKIEIIDLLGRVAMVRKWPSYNSLEISINISMLSSQLYWVVISSEDEILLREKIMNY